MPRVVVNGTPTTASTGSLLEVLRDAHLALRKGCDEGRCGSCRVLVDGAIVNSCVIHASSLREDAVIETYEAVAEEPGVTRVVEAFIRERPTRCELCVAGLGVTAAALSRERTSIDEAIGEAACMCTGRGSWRRALYVL
jgi:aerobic-type carbon monoxide dehydrogenase small subunit (CoxS/CutS family)